MLVLPVLYACVQPLDPPLPARIDDAYVRSLEMRETLWPQQATVVLLRELRGHGSKWDLKKAPVAPTTLPKANAERVAAVVNRIVWPGREHLGAFVRFVSGVSPLLTSDEEARAFGWALPLICAAWDVAMSRRQFTSWVAGVVCTDPEATLLGGRQNDISSTLSPDWPWRKVAGRYALRPVAFPPVPGGDPEMTVRKYVESWDRFDRDRSF